MPISKNVYFSCIASKKIFDILSQANKVSQGNISAFAWHALFEFIKENVYPTFVITPQFLMAAIRKIAWNMI